MTLNANELRVLGALIEKEITTPETYPLSLNALQAACNQRSSRDPVLDLSESEIRDALRALEDLDLVTPVRDARVPKFEHRARTVLNLRRDETAILALLLLRGPQTPGELRSRADRLYTFDDLASVTSTLERLAARPPAPDPETLTPDATGPLTAILPRQPGARESRYMHLLGDTATTAAPQQSAVSAHTTPNATSDVATLRNDIAALHAAVAALAQRVAALEGADLSSPGLSSPDHSGLE